MILDPKSMQRDIDDEIRNYLLCKVRAWAAAETVQIPRDQFLICASIEFTYQSCLQNSHFKLMLPDILPGGSLI